MKHPLHVVYIITKLELGGAQKVCLTLFEQLRNKGIITQLISGKEGILIDQVTKMPHSILFDELCREVGGIFQEIKCFFKLHKILRDLKKQHPNLIVHTHSTKAGLLGRWAAFFAGISYRVHTIHGYGFNNYQHWTVRYSIIFLEWITGFITTHFICVSTEDTKNGIRLLPGFSHRHSIIRAAIDYQKFYNPTITHTQFPDKQKTFVFGTIACFKKQKNLFDLLCAFQWAYNHDNTIRLEIIGDGILHADIVHWITQHALQKVITLHGWQHNVIPYMLNWHCFTLSSLWEGLPCSIVEARCLKLPVISYNTGGISDIILHEKNGLLCTPGDWLSLAQNMYFLKKNPHIHASLSTYKDNLADFTSENMIQQHIDLYASLHKKRNIQGKTY